MVPDPEAINETWFAQQLIAIELGLREWPEPDAKRHHFVPKLLLNRFATDGWITQLEKESGRPQQVRPDKAASKKHFYRFSNDDGESSNVIEGIFGMVEDDAAPVLLSVEETGEMNDHERASISTFLAYQWGRTPAARQRAETIGEQLRLGNLAQELNDKQHFQEKILRLASESDGLPRTPEEIESLRERMLGQLRAEEVLSKDPDGGYTTGSLLEVSHDLAMSMFLEMGWILLRAPEGSSFVTSDVGVTAFDPDPAHPWAGVTPLSSPAAQTYIPISSDCCLLLSPGEPTFACEEVVKAFVDEINLRMYGWADGYIYGRNQEIVVRVRRKLKTSMRRFAEPASKASFTTLIARDPGDDRLARAHVARGWPPYLMAVDDDGVPRPHDYMVLGEDGNAVEVALSADALVEERERKRLGLGPDDVLEGGLRHAHVPNSSVLPTPRVEGAKGL
jgi:hypothetical protein